MGLFQRIFAPRIAELKAEKLELAARIADLETRLVEERQANREHEDLLLNAALQAKGLSGVPTREVLTASDPNAADIQTVGSDSKSFDEQVLEDRAKQYAEITYGEDFSEEQYEATLAEMNKNPAYWTSN